jgi:hypothetical protein
MDVTAYDWYYRDYAGTDQIRLLVVRLQKGEHVVAG